MKKLRWIAPSNSMQFFAVDMEKLPPFLIKKFGGRMQAMKALSNQVELQTLHDQSFDFMLDLWRKAKAITKEDNVC